MNFLEKWLANASGEVRVLKGPIVDPNSTWNTIELLTLKQNPNVTKVVEVDYYNGKANHNF